MRTKPKFNDGHGRGKDAEIEYKGAHNECHDQHHDNVRTRADVSQPLTELTFSLGNLGNRVEFSLPKQCDRNNGRRVARCGKRQCPTRSEGRYGEAGKRGPNQSRGVEHHRVHANRIGDVSRADEFADERHPRGCFKCLTDSEPQSECINQWEGSDAHHHRDSENQPECQFDECGCQNDCTTTDPVN